MEWDGGTIWRVALGVFFVLFGVGLAYALFRLGSVFSRLHKMLTDANARLIPLLTRIETTLDGVNSELDKVDEITGSVVGIVKAAEHTKSAVRAVVSAPVRKISGLLAGARGSLRSFADARRKGYY
jgi:hypothetical protein